MRISTLFIALIASMAAPVFAQDSALTDATIIHMPKDGVVKLYGAGGPHTAFAKVVKAWQKRTDQAIEIIAGPECKWSPPSAGRCRYFMGHA